MPVGPAVERQHGGDPGDETAGRGGPRRAAAAPAEAPHQPGDHQLEQRDRRRQRGDEHQHVERTGRQRPQGHAGKRERQRHEHQPGAAGRIEPVREHDRKHRQPGQQRDQRVGDHRRHHHLLQVDVRAAVGRIGDHQPEAGADREEAEAERVERGARVQVSRIERQQEVQRGGEVALRRPDGEHQHQRDQQRHQQHRRGLDALGDAARDHQRRGGHEHRVPREHPPR